MEEGEKKLKQEKIDRHRRINRARKELSKVVRGLPEDMSFNIIAYSSDVMPWKKELVPSKKPVRKKALEFIEEMKAGVMEFLRLCST